METILCNPLPDSFELLEVHAPSGKISFGPNFLVRVDAEDLAALLKNAVPAKVDDELNEFALISWAHMHTPFKSLQVHEIDPAHLSLFRLNMDDHPVGILMLDKGTSPILQLYLNTMDPKNFLSAR